MKHLKRIVEKKPKGAPDWHDSDAPDANGRFRDLSPKDLAAWLIKTRKGDVKRISGSLTQQVIFNRNEDPKYADKMEKTRKEVYKQLDRQDLLDNMEESMNEAYKYVPQYDNEGYKAASKLISNLQSKQYRKFNDEELEEFTRAMLSHFSADIPKHLQLQEAKPGPDAYMTGLDDETEEEKEDMMKKQGEADDDDPSAYKDLPGDEEAREKGKVKTSKHVKSYHDLYGDDKNESIVNEEKATGDRGKISDDAIETGLKNKQKETGVPIALLRIVMRRGMAAWKSGHRPGATQQQWGYARVNSFLTKQPGTWGGADKDVAKEVRDGGHDSKLKKA